MSPEDRALLAELGLKPADVSTRGELRLARAVVELQRRIEQLEGGTMAARARRLLSGTKKA